MMRENLARKWDMPDPSYEPNQEKQSVVKVRKKGWITKGEKVLYSLAVVILAAACIYVVSFASATDSINRDVEALKEDVQQQKSVNEELVFEKKQLQRPERITKIAKENGLRIQDAQVKQATGYNSN